MKITLSFLLFAFITACNYDPSNGEQIGRFASSLLIGQSSTEIDALAQLYLGDVVVNDIGDGIIDGEIPLNRYKYRIVEGSQLYEKCDSSSVCFPREFALMNAPVGRDFLGVPVQFIEVIHLSHFGPPKGLMGVNIDFEINLFLDTRSNVLVATAIYDGT